MDFGYKPVTKKESLRYTFVDKQIRDAVKELNDGGFTTVLSCAGHTREKLKTLGNKQLLVVQGIGYITFKRSSYSDAPIKQIMQKHGLRGMRRIDHVDNRKEYTTVIFKPMGTVFKSHAEEGFAIKKNKLKIY